MARQEGIKMKKKIISGIAAFVSVAGIPLLVLAIVWGVGGPAAKMMSDHEIIYAC